MTRQTSSFQSMMRPLLLVLVALSPKANTQDATAHHPEQSVDSQRLSALRAAANRDDPQAEQALGEMYRDGRGVPQNASLSSAYLSKAKSDLAKGQRKANIEKLKQDADQGNLQAARDLADIYRNGPTELQNPLLAAGYLAQANANGDRTAFSAGYQAESDRWRICAEGRNEVQQSCISSRAHNLQTTQQVHESAASTVGVGAGSAGTEANCPTTASLLANRLPSYPNNAQVTQLRNTMLQSDFRDLWSQSIARMPPQQVLVAAQQQMLQFQLAEVGARRTMGQYMGVTEPPELNPTIAGLRNGSASLAADTGSTNASGAAAIAYVMAYSGNIMMVETYKAFKCFAGSP